MSARPSARSSANCLAGQAFAYPQDYIAGFEDDEGLDEDFFKSLLLMLPARLADYFSSPLLCASKTRQGKLVTGPEREKSLRKLLRNGPAQQVVADMTLGNDGAAQTEAKNGCISAKQGGTCSSDLQVAARKRDDVKLLVGPELPDIHDEPGIWNVAPRFITSQHAINMLHPLHCNHNST